jgi:hypothetical protein
MAPLWLIPPETSGLRFVVHAWTRLRLLAEEEQ